MKTNNNKGFTLVELLVSLVISSIVMAGIISSFTGQQESNLSQKQVVEMQQHIRAGLYIMTIEIRMAGYDPYSMYNAGITNTGDGSSGNPLTFNYVADDDGNDNDNDGSVDEEGEFRTISFQLYDAYGDGDDDIGMIVGGGNNQAIAENIDNFKFTYLDENRIETANPAEIKAIQIDITAKVNKDTTDYTTQNAIRNVSTIVQCRNLNL